MTPPRNPDGSGWGSSPTPKELSAVLALAAAKLPSLEVDWDYGRLTGAYLINLGSARTAQVLRITDLLRKGLRCERRADGV
ncbi:hypothetical protein J5Y04_05580 [Kitasatospora sp. RG8]|uniref:hypothetical protein n=1 Tax=Kitasatospora sp. RG8 TaxID=2820815 RepID=UPI001AE01135|nr:hypothetical protein [Kitasatospora sp. RG8]MBP0449014.1 hypothetical protein [Kitasatospora sp. RG8]